MQNPLARLRHDASCSAARRSAERKEREFGRVLIRCTIAPRIIRRNRTRHIAERGTVVRDLVRGGRTGDRPKLVFTSVGRTAAGKTRVPRRWPTGFDRSYARHQPGSMIAFRSGVQRPCRDIGLRYPARPSSNPSFRRFGRTAQSEWPVRTTASAVGSVRTHTSSCAVHHRTANGRLSQCLDENREIIASEPGAFFDFSDAYGLRWRHRRGWKGE